MLKVSKSQYLKSISITTSISESILEKSILSHFKKPGKLISNYLEHEIEEYVRYVLRIYTDYILMADELKDFYECFTNINIYET